MKDTSGMGYAGFSGPGFSRNNSAKVLVNQHTGYMNDGRLVNKGRGPTVGNKGTKSTPGTSSMPSCDPGHDMFKGSANPQVRNPGGTTAMPKVGKESFNYGRGPTKGNMQ
jgi:hypothetical protein